MDRHTTANLRTKSLSAAVLLVAAVFWVGFSQKYPVGVDRDASHGVLAIVETVLPRVVHTSPPRPPAMAHPNQGASAPSAQPSQDTTPARATAINLGCINTLGREDSERCNNFTAPGAQREIVIPPVHSVPTAAQQRNRLILGALTDGAATYARGEAQKYADPHDDPLYDPGTDPSIAAMRPCAGQSATRGTGAHLTGRSCQMYH